MRTQARTRRSGALALALGCGALLVTVTACGQGEPSSASGVSGASSTAGTAGTSGRSPSPTPTKAVEIKHPSPSHPRLPTSAEVVENKSSYASRYSPPADAEVVELEEGRRVAMYYEQGRGLVEQHYSAQAEAWSKPQTLYRTRTDPCASLTLKDFDGTVAVIANFALYCTDGEPPAESIAAVGVGNLEKWYVHLTKHFDGWRKVKASSDTSEVTFTFPYSKGLTTPAGTRVLRWSRAEGFSDLEDIPR
ncbi:hypothetical protein ACFS5L_44705 [Streptomyces phyllanthi]|uniref:hypothetical protein n=2 Tax=Streptomyces phyllanthi TaxID=1803180 RepID=UPI0031ECE603